MIDTCLCVFIFWQTDLDARVRRDVENARQRREEARKKDQERQLEADKRKAAASERWAAVTVDSARILKATKVGTDVGGRNLYKCRLRLLAKH